MRTAKQQSVLWQLEDEQIYCGRSFHGLKPILSAVGNVILCWQIQTEGKITFFNMVVL